MKTIGDKWRRTGESEGGIVLYGDLVCGHAKIIELKSGDWVVPEETACPVCDLKLNVPEGMVWDAHRGRAIRNLWKYPTSPQSAPKDDLLFKRVIANLSKVDPQDAENFMDGMAEDQKATMRTMMAAARFAMSPYATPEEMLRVERAKRTMIAAAKDRQRDE